MTARYDLSNAVAVHVSVNSAGCTRCGDEFAPIEGSPVPLDPDEPRFCSSDCEEAWTAAEDAAEAYGAAGDPAQVFEP